MCMNHSSLYYQITEHLRPLAGTQCIYSLTDGQAELTNKDVKVSPTQY